MIIQLTGDICDSVTNEIFKLITSKRPDKILVAINSYGGVTEQGFAISSMLEASGASVDTLAFGAVASQAFSIFMCGTNRYTIADAYFMAHKIQYPQSNDDTTAQELQLKKITIWNDKYIDSLLVNVDSKKRGRLRSEIRKGIELDVDHEYTLNGTDAFKKGIATHILADASEEGDYTLTLFELVRDFGPDIYTINGVESDDSE